MNTFPWSLCLQSHALDTRRFQEPRLVIPLRLDMRM